MVNRVWSHHFGAGLVRTPSDFGTRSEPPTHPELLDWLASVFMQEGWSIKRLHRRILLSNAYRQSADDNPRARRFDSENRLLWRMNRQRLDFEAMHDSLLAVTGELDTALGGRPVDLTATPSLKRRAIYGYIDRQNLPNLLRTFDFANPDTHSPQRFVTTVPQQALFLLNSPFMAERAKALVKRAVAPEGTPATLIQRLYLAIFQREPTTRERELGEKFLTLSDKTDSNETPPASPLSTWERYAQTLLLANEFLFVD
jgi:hypothetical protein